MTARFEVPGGEARLTALHDENELLRREIRTAHEAADVNARLVVRQFEETEKVMRRLQESNSLRKAVLDAASEVAIVAADASGQVRLFNSGAEGLLGYTADEVVGRLTPLAFHLDSELDERRRELGGDCQESLDGVGLFVELAKRGRAAVKEWTYVAKGGHQLPVIMSVTAVHDAEGAPAGFLCAATNIAERKRAERELLEAMRAAEEANRMKSTFLANMSHELRTPLNAIIGYAELLQDDAEDQGNGVIVPDLQKIQGAARHLLSLINDVLDLSKIEAGKMDLSLEEFEVRQAIGDVVSMVQPLVERNGNVLQVDAADDVGTVRADLTRVRQVLFNLLSNACKFTERGTITIRARREQEGRRECLVVRVVDTGMGMSAEQCAQLFQAFVQVGKGGERKYGGTGLGLAISRRFCQMMGGDVTVESTPGGGTTFTVLIPTIVGGEEPPEPRIVPELVAAPEAAVDGEVVVTIDDDPAVRELITRIFERVGLRVVSASRGDEGIQLVRELRPIAITLDIMMPGHDGWEVLRELKGDPELAAIPVVVLTILEDERKGYALGAADFLTKPIDRDRLIAAVGRYSHQGGVAPVLVVEDEDTTRAMVARTLEREGLPVQVAENGVVALERIASLRPSAILLDLMMPEMDGFELMEELRRHPEWSTIPIIVMTAKDLTASDRLRLNGYVLKVLRKGAYSHTELLDEVRDIVLDHARRRRGRPLSASP